MLNGKLVTGFQPVTSFQNVVLIIAFIAHRVDTIQATPTAEFDRCLSAVAASKYDLLA